MNHADASPLLAHAPSVAWVNLTHALGAGEEATIEYYHGRTAAQPQGSRSAFLKYGFFDASLPLWPLPPVVADLTHCAVVGDTGPGAPPGVLSVQLRNDRGLLDQLLPQLTRRQRRLLLGPDSGALLPDAGPGGEGEGEGDGNGSDGGGEGEGEERCAMRALRQALEQRLAAYGTSLADDRLVGASHARVGQGGSGHMRARWLIAALQARMAEKQVIDSALRDVQRWQQQWPQQQPQEAGCEELHR